MRILLSIALMLASMLGQKSVLAQESETATSVQQVAAVAAHPPATIRQDLLSAHTAAKLQGDLETQAAVLRQLIQLDSDLLGEDADRVAWHWRDLAEVLSEREELKAAEAAAEKAREILQRTHPQSDWRWEEAQGFKDYLVALHTLPRTERQAFLQAEREYELASSNQDWTAALQAAQLRTETLIRLLGDRNLIAIKELMAVQEMLLTLNQVDTVEAQLVRLDQVIPQVSQLPNPTYAMLAAMGAEAAVRAGDLPLADIRYQRSLTLYEQSDLPFLSEYAITHNNYAVLLESAGESDQAFEHYRQAVGLWTQHLDTSDAGFRQLQRNLFAMLIERAAVAEVQHQWEAADSLLSEALELASSAWGDDGPEVRTIQLEQALLDDLRKLPPQQLELFDKYHDLSSRAWELQDSGNAEEAIELKRQIIKLAQELFGPKSYYSLKAEFDLEQSLPGDEHTALKYAQFAERFAEWVGTHHTEYADAAIVQAGWTEPSDREAIELAKAAVDIYFQQRGRWSREAAVALSVLGRLQYKCGDPGSEDSLLEALQIWEGLDLDPCDDHFNVYSDLASVYRERGKLESALSYSALAVEYADQFPELDPYSLAVELLQQGDILSELARSAAAVEAYHNAARAARSLDDTELYRIALIRVGVQHFGSERYSATADVLSLLFEDDDSELDLNDPLCISAVDYLAAAYRNLQRYDDALKIVSQLDNAIKAAGGTEIGNPYAVAKIQRVATLIEQQELGQARELLHELVDRLRSKPDAYQLFEDSAWFECLTNVRSLSDALQQDDLGLWARRELLERAERLLGSKPWELADARQELTDARILAELDAESQAELERAGMLLLPTEGGSDIGALREAHDIYDRILGAEHAESRDALATLGHRLRELGQFEAAYQVYLQLAHLNEQVLGEQHAKTAEIKTQAAIAARGLSRYEEAEELLKDSLATMSQIYGKDSAWLAGQHHSLAILYQEAGRHADALPAAREAVTRFRGWSGEQSYDHANALTTLYAVCSDLGMNEEAVDALNASHAIIKSLYKATDLEYLDSILAGAIALSSLGSRDELVEDLYQEAIAGYEAIRPRGMASYANALNGYGNFCLWGGEPAKALELYRQVLVVREEYYDQPNHPMIAQAHSQIGTAALRLEDLESAESHLITALEMRQDVLGKDSAEVVFGLFNLARVKAFRGETQTAYQMLTRCLEIEQQTLAQNFIVGDDEAIASVLDSNKDRYAWLLAMHLAGTAPEGELEAALAWTLNRKGYALDAACKLQALQKQLLHDPEVMRLQTEIKTLRHSLAGDALSYQQQEKVGPFGTRTKTVVRIDELQERLAQRMRQFAGDPHSSRVDVAELRNRIPQGCALLEFVITSNVDVTAPGEESEDEHVVAFFVPSTGKGAVRLVDLGPYGEIQEQIEAIRDHFKRFGRSLRLSSEADLEVQFRELASPISQALLQPFQEDLAELDQIVISPDGALHQLPFAALSGTQGDYLAEELTISYVTSGRDLLRDYSSVGTGSLVLADPDFDTDPEAPGSPSIVQNTRGSALLAQRGGELHGDDLRSLLWRALPGARQEAADISSQLEQTGYAPVETYVGAAATESVVMKAVSPRLIHLATHGFFVPYEELTSSTEDVRGGTALGRLRYAESPLLRSGVVLTGANFTTTSTNSVEKANDGWLTAEEIASLDLRNTELVVLSACESGLGKVERGHGVRGLQRAFLMAGAHSLLTTLFEIPDLETRDLVNSFYGHLTKAHSGERALQAAQREMILERRAEHGASHPFYWASFVMQGRPKTVNP